MNMSIYNDILPLTNFLCSGLYNIYMNDRITSCNYKDILSYMTYVKMTENPNLTFNKYVNGVKIESNISEIHIIDKPHVLLEEDNFELYICDAVSLHNLINQKNKIISKHILAKLYNIHHCIMYIVNKNDKTISVFDSSDNLQIIKRIEKILVNVIQEYNIMYSDNYILLQIDIWNDNNIVLNTHHKTSPIYDTGFCVMLSIIVAHYMIITNKDIKTVVKIFSNFTYDEILSIINDYSLFYYFTITM